MADLPDVLWLVRGEWPIRAFTSEAQAMHWTQIPSLHRRRIWRVRIAEATELLPVNPKPYLEE